MHPIAATAGTPYGGSGGFPVNLANRSGTSLLGGRRPPETTPPVPADHRLALDRERERSRAERAQVRLLLHQHRDALERVRHQLARDRALARRAYDENRWWIELALAWWTGRAA